MKQTVAGMILFTLLAVPPIRELFESAMITHMLVQLPLLIVSGWLMGSSVINRYHNFFQKWNADGVAGMLLVVTITMYWMLPRVLDESLVIWYIELFKFTGLSFLTGISLRDSWKKLGVIGKSFIFLNYLSMFALMAWVYIDIPVQICNNYLEVEQKMLGWGFLAITLAMVLYIIQQVFTDHSA
ncbi:hypothetical protein ACFSMW_13735 [Virgibacillus halophilus]|uniref:Intracellular septation protein A n=1 Tax=Tigheibacillus halophilus TaxID=361280 RepID=A0ABU5C2B2_9BACI|nr:hypothetical protein [Virgibacillus halophilus]